MYVADVFDFSVVVELDENGEEFEYTKIENDYSMLFDLKSDAEMFLSTAPQNRKELTAVHSVCGCLEDGDLVALVMPFGDHLTAYCEQCA